MLDGRWRARCRARPRARRRGPATASGSPPTRLTVFGLVFSVGTAFAHRRRPPRAGRARRDRHRRAATCSTARSPAAAARPARAARSSTRSPTASPTRVLLGGVAWYLAGEGPYLAGPRVRGRSRSRCSSPTSGPGPRRSASTARGGLMERAERIVLLGIGLAFDILVPVLWVMLVLTAITAVQRFVKVWRQADRPQRPRRTRRRTAATGDRDERATPAALRAVVGGAPSADRARGAGPRARTSPLTRSRAAACRSLPIARVVPRVPRRRRGRAASFPRAVGDAARARHRAARAARSCATRRAPGRAQPAARPRARLRRRALRHARRRARSTRTAATGSSCSASRARPPQWIDAHFARRRAASTSRTALAAGQRRRSSRCRTSAAGTSPAAWLARPGLRASRSSSSRSSRRSCSSGSPTHARATRHARSSRSARRPARTVLRRAARQPRSCACSATATSPATASRSSSSASARRCPAARRRSRCGPARRCVPAGVYFRPHGRHHRADRAPPVAAEREGRLRDDVARVTQELAHQFEELIRVAARAVAPACSRTGRSDRTPMPAPVATMPGEGRRSIVARTRCRRPAACRARCSGSPARCARSASTPASSRRATARRPSPGITTVGPERRASPSNGSIAPIAAGRSGRAGARSRRCARFEPDVVHLHEPLVARAEPRRARRARRPDGRHVPLRARRTATRGTRRCDRRCGRCCAGSRSATAVSDRRGAPGGR